MKKLTLAIFMAFLLFLVACEGTTVEDVQEVVDQAQEVVEQVATEAGDEIQEAVDAVIEEVQDALECTDAIGCVEVDAGDPIRIASALVVTGPNESLGLDSQYGVEIAIGDRGELMGHPIELQAEDDGCSAEGGQTAGQKIVSDPTIAGVIGTSCSGAGVPMSQIVCEAGVAMISPSNTAPVLTGEGTRQSCYFRTAHNDEIQGAAMANFVINELGLTKAAAIHDGDPYTEGLASAFSNAFQDLGGEIVAFEAEAADATNVEPLLTSVSASGPEIIFAPVFIPLGSLIAKTVQEIDGLEGVVLAAADGVLSPDFLEAAGDAAEGMYLSGPDLNFGNEIYDQFLVTYEANYGSEPISAFHAHAYDATNMLLNGIEAVAQVDADGNMLIGRQALIDALAATQGMPGITGTISCQPNGDCADPKIAVNEVSGGEFNAIWAFGDESAMMEEEEAMADAGEMKVCQVTDVGGIDDKSFNATAWAGAERAAGDFGVEIKFLESQQQTDYDKNLQAFIDDGCDLIIAVGFLMADATAASAAANPDQNYTIIDVDYLDFPNLLGIGFEIDQAGFLAGYTAANATQTGVVGTFGGVNIPPVTAFMDGYVLGVDYYNAQNGTEVSVLGWDVVEQDGLFTGNFESTDDGRAFGESLMDEGADVIMPVAGPVGLGTAAAIQERGNAWLIGVDTDWTVSAPEFADIVLTSVLKRLDTASYASSQAVVEGTFEGGLWVGNLANDGVGITDPVVPVDGLDEIIDGIIAGAIPTRPGQEAMMEEEAMADGSDMKVCQVTDVGGIDDKSFNATAWAGAEQAAADFGVEIKFLESQQQTDYDKNLQAFIDDGCDLIIAVGFLMADATAASAEANPDQNFTIIDVDYLDFPNLLGIGFEIDQAGFLAGYTAANATQTGVVGTFGGVNIPPVTAFMDGYVLGVDYYNAQNGTEVSVLGWDVAEQDGLFTGNFESTDDGRAFGESLMDEGADVIMPVAGPVGLGTAAAIQERGNAWLIGVDTDWTVSAPEFADIVLTSVLKRLDTASYASSQAVVEGTFEGGLWVGNLANDGVGITDPVVPVDGLDEIIDGIIAGEIETSQ